MKNIKDEEILKLSRERAFIYKEIMIRIIKKN
jgi:hypothetical protein